MSFPCLLIGEKEKSSVNKSILVYFNFFLSECMDPSTIEYSECPLMYMQAIIKDVTLIKNLLNVHQGATIHSEFVRLIPD